jgi:multiple antibiotic resistance protein
MKDLAYAFTLYFATLGPVKTIPAFFMATHNADRRTVLTLAAKSTAVATAIVLFVALVASGVLVTWRVSIEAIGIAGGVMLLITSIKTLSGFSPIDTPARVESNDSQKPSAALDTRWMGRPVLSPLAIPSIVTPMGIVVVLFFAGIAAGDSGLQIQLVSLLLVIMAANFVAMLLAGPIMRVVGVPVLQIVGWVFSALQAGLAVQFMITALQRLD